MSRIWIFNHDACSPSTGPMLRHYNFAKYLDKMGHNVTVFAQNHIHFNDRVIEIERGNYLRHDEDGVDFVRVKTRAYSGNGISRVLNWYSYYRRLFKISKKLNKSGECPDIIIGSSVHPLACVAAIKIAKKFKVPAIAEIRDLWPEAIFMAGFTREKSLIGRALTRLEHWIYKHADQLIFTKEGDKDHLLEMGWDRESGGDIDMRKCNYINNGVDLDSYNAQINEKILEDADLDNKEKFKLVYTGTLRPMNNIDLILDAAKILQKKDPDIQILIFGDGNQRERLEKRKFDENIENLYFKGFVNKEKIPNILSKSSANILNYSQANYNWTRGNSSNKLFEYMASGKPIISTIQMGYSIIERYDCGIELEKQSAEALADAVLELKKLPEERLTEIAKNAQGCAKDFDFKHLSQKLENLIKQTLIH